MAEHTKGELSKGCVVFMKSSSGLMGYGNPQCISEVHHESLGTISLYGHNQHYKTYDIDRIIEYPQLKAQRDALLAAYRDLALPILESSHQQCKTCGDTGRVKKREIVMYCIRCENGKICDLHTKPCPDCQQPEPDETSKAFDRYQDFVFSFLHYLQERGDVKGTGDTCEDIKQKIFDIIDRQAKQNKELQNKENLARAALIKFEHLALEEQQGNLAKIKHQSEEIERLKETLYHECPNKFPDNCEVCKGANLGVRGNENIVNGVVMCDYCHIQALNQKEDE